MIHNTQTVKFDGTNINKEAFVNAFSFNGNDSFTRWVLRPITTLAVIGLGVAMFFASAFLIVLSLAMLPLLALAYWAVKTKIDRDIANADPVIDTQTPSANQPDDSVGAPT